jgi:hypothetical protein
VSEDSNNIGFNRYNIELSSKQFLPGNYAWGSTCIFSYCIVVSFLGNA